MRQEQHGGEGGGEVGDEGQMPKQKGTMSKSEHVITLTFCCI